MAETENAGDGKPAGAAAGQSVQVRVGGQYIKDLSFENPNVDKLLTSPPEKPNLRVEVNVNAAKLGDKAYESTIHFKAEATSNDAVIYDMELSYAGLFQIEGMPEDSLEPFLLVNCPALLFPFLRRLVSDITREGGFPPLLLDPIDFASLFIARKQKEKEGQQANTN
ncbi:MAG TPA: protein-export chaperone SecB [Hyphomicrobiaceae bacterium]|nr:protein-export chaperone SecB [Hyphomicrobiaceae bacterium]